MHYKIIFIKAPSSAPSYNLQAIQQQLSEQQTEEKTLVYVLSKKQDEIPLNEIIAAKQAQSAPSKPEV